MYYFVKLFNLNGNHQDVQFAIEDHMYKILIKDPNLENLAKRFHSEYGKEEYSIRYDSHIHTVKDDAGAYRAEVAEPLEGEKFEEIISSLENKFDLK